MGMRHRPCKTTFQTAKYSGCPTLATKNWYSSQRKGAPVNVNRLKRSKARHLFCVAMCSRHGHGHLTREFLREPAQAKPEAISSTLLKPQTPAFTLPVRTPHCRHAVWNISIQSLLFHCMGLSKRKVPQVSILAYFLLHQKIAPSAISLLISILSKIGVPSTV